MEDEWRKRREARRAAITPEADAEIRRNLAALAERDALRRGLADCVPDPETLDLARRAAESNERRKGEDVNKWAERIARDVGWMCD